MCRAVLRTGILRPLSVMAALVSAGVLTNTAMRSQDPADRETLPVVQTLKHTHISLLEDVLLFHKAVCTLLFVT